MAAQLFTNNGASTLASGITNVATSLTLATGDGSRFPVLSGGDWFMLTLTQANTETSWEIVKVTARSGDVLTIVRAQEGSTAAAWATGDKAELRVTAETMNSLADDASLAAHTSNTSNPHSVTKGQVGLGNAENKAFDVGVADATHAATSKATPVDADELPISDSAATFGLKKLTWANLKATAKTYFDTLYLGISATATNASQLLGSTWASPPAIGSTTPAAGSFTTLSASGASSFATGSTVGATVTGGASAFTIKPVGGTNSDALYSSLGAGGVYLTTPGAGNVYVNLNSVNVGTFSSTGLAVTGALSATGNISTVGSSNPNLSLQLTNTGSLGRDWQIISSSVGGMDGGGTFTVRDNTAGLNRLTVDASGNLGLGVTPSAWSGNSVKAIQMSTAGAVWALDAGSNNRQTLLSSNLWNVGGTSYYIVSDKAAMYSLSSSGTHSWYTAPSGTAGNAISFTQAMTLDASGNLNIANLTASKVVFTDASKNLTTTGTIAVDQGGTGAATLTGILKGNGTSAFTAATSNTDYLPVSGAVTSGITLNDGYTEEVYAVSGTTPALSPTNGSIQTWALSGNSTPTAGTWAAGQSITLMIDDGTAYTVTWTSLAVTWKTGRGTAPTLLTSGYTVIELWKVGSTIYGALVGNA